jgi:hypothetical protein
MSNATKVNRVDNVHNKAEQDLGEILGVPDGTQITNPILGVGPGSTPSVQSDGSIRGCPVLKMSSATSNPANAIGFEFKDGTATKRLVMTDSGLKIWNWTGTTWAQVANLENPGSGAGTFLSLSDVTDEDYTGKAGYLVKVNAGATALELVAPTAGTGVTTFVGLGDTPASLGTAGQIVTVLDANNLTFSNPPSGVGDPFIMWLEAVATTSGWGRNSWIDVYNWAYTSVPDDGGFLTDDTALLSPGTLPQPNRDIELDAGVYEIGFWYYSTTSNKTGTRMWKVVQQSGSIATTSPACLGVEQVANLWFNSTSNAGGLSGLHALSQRQLIVLSDNSKIKFQVRQSSNTVLQGVTFFSTITKVK